MTDNINWDEIIEKAKADTDNKFKNRMSSLTSLTNAEIDGILQDSGIDKKNFAAVLSEIDNATKSNTEKVKAITNIKNGVELLIGIAKKFL